MNVCQTAVLSMRIFDELIRGTTLPCTTPAVTVARTPETWTCSATMYVTNETRSEAVVARIVSSR